MLSEYNCLPLETGIALPQGQDAVNVKIRLFFVSGGSSEYNRKLNNYKTLFVSKHVLILDVGM